MRYAVMLECRAGTYELVDRAWVDRYHTITWVVEDHLATALATTCHELATNPRELRRAWVEPRPEAAATTHSADDRRQPMSWDEERAQAATRAAYPQLKRWQEAWPEAYQELKAIWEAAYRVCGHRRLAQMLISGYTPERTDAKGTRA